MKTVPYVTFDGKCRDAFEFYKQLFGGQLDISLHRDTPAAEHVPADWQDTVMHAHLHSGGVEVMGSDTPPQYQQKLGGFSISIHPETEADAERIFKALEDGGTVTMPLETTFWAKRFGMVTDRFGVPWMLNVM